MAYLTHSPYGRNGNEITINNSSNYITGNAGNLASTTGNITGIYDMSGGAWEYVAAWNKNSTSSYISSNGSSFASQGGSSTKYATAYNGDSSDVPSSSRCIVGDATYEVYVGSYRAWFSEYSKCAYSSNPFFIRGGGHYNASIAGIFCSNSSEDVISAAYSFRVCLCGV